VLEHIHRNGALIPTLLQRHRRSSASTTTRRAWRNKEGWDNIDIFGWLGYKMQIQDRLRVP
jgi:hypothetical protein